MSDTPNRSDERETAAEWLVRLESDDATEADWRTFEAWLADPKNKAAVAQVENATAELEENADAIKAALTSRAASEGPTEVRPRAAQVRGRGLAIWALAGGGLAAAAAMLVLVVVRSSPAPAADIVYAAKGEVLRIVLPDSSEVVLDRDAAIRVQFDHDTRRVVLDRGEAAFSVKHDPAHPFVVVAGLSSVTDLGTEFDILRRPEGLVVTVRQGSVAVMQTNSIPVTVQAGTQLRTGEATHTATSSKVNPDDAFAWQQGRVVFHDQSLAEVVEALNRYGDVHIKLASPEVGALRFSGALMVGSSSGMVSQLLAFLPVRADAGQGEIIIKRR